MNFRTSNVIALEHLSPYERILVLMRIINLTFKVYDTHACFCIPSREASLKSLAVVLWQAINQLSFEMESYERDAVIEADLELTNKKRKAVMLAQYALLSEQFRGVMTLVESHAISTAHPRDFL